MTEDQIFKFDLLKAILRSGDENWLLKSAEFLVNKMADKKVETTLNKATCEFFVLQYITWLLTVKEYERAASLLWGPEMFTTEPESVKIVWDEIPLQSKILIMGSGSVGKSYTLAVWLLLDWLVDPEGTCIKVISSTKGHAKRNVFAHIQNLHRNAIVPLPGVVDTLSIKVNEDEKQGIHLMAIPAGESGKGRLRGFHPAPRPVAHKKFGQLTRIRAILDEAEEIPEGVWEDVGNMLITMDGVENVKVVCATNPKDRASKFGQMCEPVAGWDSVDIETSQKWTSTTGWQIIRLDGARCQNVIQQKIVYPGLITWEGYKAQLAYGDRSPNFFTMARGWFPDKGIFGQVIPIDFISRAKGIYVFSGRTTRCASFDLAFEGDDQVIMTIGIFGEVTGWIPFGGGKTIQFPVLPDGVRHGLQIERQLSLPKMKTKEQSEQMIDALKNLNIPGRMVIVDRTGNGTGVHDMLQSTFSPEVMGLHFGTAATETKLMDDDTQKCSDMYDGVVTELFFALKRWIEFDYVKFGPSLDLIKLEGELTARRYCLKGKKNRVESKGEYKSRGNKSPDWADSLTMLVHLVRMKSDFTASMLPVRSEQSSPEQSDGIVDKLAFLTFDA